MRTHVWRHVCKKRVMVPDRTMLISGSSSEYAKRMLLMQICISAHNSGSRSVLVPPAGPLLQVHLDVLVVSTGT